MLQNPRLTPDYEWIVTKDPTSYLFLGRIFRTIDIHDHNCNCDGWPDGMQFRNLRTPEVRMIEGGQVLVSLRTGCPAAHQLAARALELFPSRRGSAINALHAHLLACAECQAGA